MLSIIVVFWMYVILFAIIGGMRGWAKELLVSFSVILALTFSTLLNNYVEFFKTIITEQPELHFWLHTIILALLVFFGYQTPNIQRFAAKMTREKIQDTLLGAFLGAINGYLITGSVWYYLDFAQYPFEKIVQDPPAELAARIQNMMNYMPPELFGIPGIYFAVVIAFIFVLVVFI
jgi:uncharacterized membrane protein required for colicin V production